MAECLAPHSMQTKDIAEQVQEIYLKIHVKWLKTYFSSH